MPINFSDIAGGAGGGATAYKAPTAGGTVNASIDPGIYAVASDGLYPMVLTLETSGGGTYVTEITADTTFLKLDDPVVSISFENTSIEQVWNLFTSPVFTSFLGEVKYIANDNQWITHGQDGKVFTSPEGIVWTAHQVPNYTGTINDLGYDATSGVYVVVGSSYYVAHSTDGQTWTQGTVNNNLPELQTFRDVQKGGGVWVASGGAGFDGISIFYSTNDGQSWQPGVERYDINSPTSVFQIEALVYGNGRWIAPARIGDSYSSTDGFNWSVISTPNFRPEIARFLNGYFLVGEYAGNNQLGISTDGLTWTTYYLTGNRTTRGFAFENGVWYATYDTGIYKTTDVTSSTNWEYISGSDVAGNIYGGDFNSGKLIFGSNSGGVVTTENQNNYIVLSQAPITELT